MIGEENAPSEGHDEGSLRMRRVLMAHLSRMISERGLNQVQAARWLQVSQPGISQLLNGHTDRFSTNRLLDILAVAGVEVTVLLKETDGRAGTSTLATAARAHASNGV